MQRAILSTPGLQRSNLFNDELRRFDTAPLVDVEAVGQLHNTAKSRSSLVERDRIDADQQWTDLHHLSDDSHLSRNVLVARILDELMPAIDTFDAEGLHPFLDEWQQSDILRGRKIGLTLPNEYITGTACGIDDVGALLVDTGHGRRRFLSGDVSVRVA